MSGTKHDCQRIDYQSMYTTMVRTASILAEHGEYDASQELWATAMGFYDLMDGCNDHPVGTDLDQ